MWKIMFCDFVNDNMTTANQNTVKPHDTTVTAANQALRLII